MCTIMVGLNASSWIVCIDVECMQMSAYLLDWSEILNQWSACIKDSALDRTGTTCGPTIFNLWTSCARWHLEWYNFSNWLMNTSLERDKIKLQSNVHYVDRSDFEVLTSLIDVMMISFAGIESYKLTDLLVLFSRWCRSQLTALRIG